MLQAENPRIKVGEKFDKPSVSWGASTQDPTSSNKGGPAHVKQAYTVQNGKYWHSYYQGDQPPGSTPVTASSSPASELSIRESSVGDTHSNNGPEDVTFSVTLTYTDPTEKGGGAEGSITETKKVAIKFVGRGGGNRDHRSDGSVIDVAGNAPSGTGGGTGGDGGGYHDCHTPFIPGTLTPNAIVDVRTPMPLVPPTALELVSENISASGYKYGYDTYIPTTPPKRFSKKMVTTDAEGGDQETPVGGTLTEICNPPDGQEVRIAQTGNPSYYGTPPGGARTATTFNHAFVVNYYDDCPNQRPDTPAIMEVHENITEEYTTVALKTAVFEKAFDFKREGYYLRQTASAKLEVSKDELNVDYRKTKYKWRIPADTTAYPRPYKVTWVEVFTPKDLNPDDDQVPEKKYIAKSEEITGAESEEHEIDPQGRPDEEGGWEVRLVSAVMAVDANRDGEITFDGKDSTTVDQSLRFWINRDSDKLNNEEEEESATPDFQNETIENTRDLEDFQLLQVDLPADLFNKIQKRESQLGMKWKNTSSGIGPRVKIYRTSNQISDSKSYLWNNTKAETQLNSGINDNSPNLRYRSIATVEGSATVWLPSYALLRDGTDSDQHPYLLFEGSSKGKGELCLVIKTGDTEVDCPGVWLDLLDVQQMFESADGTPDMSYPNPPDSITSEPSRPATGFQLKTWPGRGSFIPAPDETDEAIIMVHGWNMTDSDRRTFSESFYKRLWWKGYKGRFSTFAWPTYNSVSDFLGYIPTHYNMSEYVGWKYGSALKAYVDSIQKSSKSVAAHSMGNIVMASALRAGLQVNNYVAMEAAIPSGCYDASPANNAYIKFLQAETTSPTPNKADPDLGYGGLMAGIGGNFHNLHSQNDFALATGIKLNLSVSWEANQVDHKPNALRHYAFYPSANGSEKYRIEIQFVDEFGASVLQGRNITDHHEIMSFIARPRSRALGAQSTAGFNTNFDLSTLARYPFGASRTEHSGQYQRPIQRVHMFYNVLIQKMQVGFNFLDDSAL